MARKKHWTQRSQARRKQGTAIRDDDGSTTWMRGYAGENANRISSGTGLGYGSRNNWFFGRDLEPEPSGGFNALGFTDPETGIRRVIFNGEPQHREELIRLGYTRVNWNASIREKDVERDYKYSKHTTKKGKMFNRPVYRVKRKKRKK